MRATGARVRPIHVFLSETNKSNVTQTRLRCYSNVCTSASTPQLNGMSRCHSLGLPSWLRLLLFFFRAPAAAAGAMVWKKGGSRLGGGGGGRSERLCCANSTEFMSNGCKEREKSVSYLRALHHQCGLFLLPDKTDVYCQTHAALLWAITCTKLAKLIQFKTHMCINFISTFLN